MSVTKGLKATNKQKALRLKGKTEQQQNTIEQKNPINKFIKEISENWASGLIVAFVALPLGIALSIASGAGPLPGVITGIWAGIVASIVGGSKFNIVGAAGALTTILYAFANFQGENLAFALPFLAIISGLIIMLVWLLKIDKYLVYVPSSVMYGFAAGVAILIAFGQINDAMGLRNVAVASGFFEKMRASIEQIHTLNYLSLITFLVSIALLLYFKKIKFKFPGAIIVSTLGIIFGWLSTRFTSENRITTLLDKFGHINPAIASFPNFNRIGEVFINQPDFLSNLITTATVIAAISILETLITARIADKATNTKSDTRKEVFGLGLANITAGFMGGLPATGVFIRTGLNIKSGAKSNMSATLVSVFTALLALVLLPLFQYIPMAVISAILFNTAIGLIELEKFERFWHKEKASLFVALLVALITVIEDAAMGILIGVVLSLLIFVDKLSRGEFEITFNANKKVVEFEQGHDLLIPKHDVDVVIYSIEGLMAYIDAQSHLENLEKITDIPSLKTLILRMRDMFFVDVDGLDALVEIITNARQRGIRVLITSVNNEVEKTFKQHPLFQEMYENQLVFSKTGDALCHIGFETCDLDVDRRRIITGKAVNRKPRLSKIFNFYNNNQDQS